MCCSEPGHCALVAIPPPGGRVAELGALGAVYAIAPFILALGLLAGCATKDDSRLQGAWRSNREATVAAAFQRDTRWTSAPEEKVARFSEMFGQMVVTYSNGMASSTLQGETGSFPYRVVQRGTDFVVIRSDAPMEKGRDIRLRFVEGDRAYWITSPFGLEERFDRVNQK